MRIAVAASLIVACGGPPPAHPVAMPLPPPVVAAPAPTTCAEAGVLLRGPIEGEGEGKAMGETRIAAIASACDEGKWNAEVLHCVGDQANPLTCLDKLTDTQHALYDGKLVAWAETNLPEPADDRDQVDNYIDCDDGLGEIAMYAPPISATGADGEFATQMRRRELLHLCTKQIWDTSLKQCLQQAHDPQATSACAARLPPEQLAELATSLGELDALVTATFAKRKKPADCARVVAVHYGDAMWKGKLDGAKPAERKKAIAESRTQMAKACNAGKWDATLRSCVVAGGNERCFAGAIYVWAYPAAGVMAGSTGVVDCDGYIDAVAKVQTCKKVAPELRDAYRDSFVGLRETFSTMRTLDPSTKQQMGEACRALREQIQSVLTNAGC